MSPKIDIPGEFGEEGLHKIIHARYRRNLSLEAKIFSLDIADTYFLNKKNPNASSTPSTAEVSDATLSELRQIVRR
jgi:hypothetical protein